MLYIAAIPWLHLGKGKWKCQFTSAVTNGITPFVYAESATEEESRLEKWSVAPWYYEQLAISYRVVDEAAGGAVVGEITHPASAGGNQ